ncbi:TBC1 domain family member 2B [Triplophysa tibetana]|uniref:TBC1 domain family member 2B n=1 Tax=Triplophysa tibetana TaxID=1572043 RepID=A0A5A9PUN0_9TELE|nr:TBC1 domain family member 2B [Triplophysa tibetana]
MHEEDDSAANSSRNSRILAARSLDVADCDGTKEQAAKLRGYLNKLSGKGPLRGFKTRWFVYDTRQCYLYYFKTPQDALPLGHIEIADACFTYDVEAEEGLFEIRTEGKEFLLKAPSRQVMLYWLQQLQQKRWEFCNMPGHRDSWCSPAPCYPHTGLVAKDAEATFFEKPNETMESVRNDFALELDSDELVGVQSARGPVAPPTAAFNSLRHWGSELRNSMSHLRAGRGGENRRSVFYTANSEEWEMVFFLKKRWMGKCAKCFRQPSIGSAFTFDFRNPSRMKRPFHMGSGKASRSLETSPVECNGNKTPELQLRIQSQQEEIIRLQEQEKCLQEDLASQKWFVRDVMKCLNALKSEELVRLLQQTLRSSQCSAGQSGSMGQDNNNQSEGERDGQIKDLCGHMERLALEKESLQKELKGLKIKVGEINERLGMLMETIQAKDEVIIKLSQQSDEGGNPSGECSSPGASREKQELDILKDSLQGYKSQNNFLNKEILELTVLRRNAEAREKILEVKYTSLVAKLCQVESKYLVLLQEVKSPVCSGSEQSHSGDVISRLLEEALQVESADQQEHTILKPNAVSEYDIYGFRTVPEEEDDEEKLEAKKRALDLRSFSLADQETSVRVKWDNYLAITMNREMVRSPDLKALMRSGVPHIHRSKVWTWCVNFHVKKIRDSQTKDYYHNLLSMANDKPNPACKQIELDLLRTLPNNKHYASPDLEGIQKLRNVLVAFSWRNPDIGYCQGLNRLAAITLLYLDQEEAFWCLVAIVEVFMPRDYYTKTLLGSQVDQRVFKDLMNEKLPRLHAHFEHYKVDFSLITFNWFLVVFVDSVVSDILFKIWDAFLYEGPKIIFRFALALFKYKEEEFLKLQDQMTIFKYLRYFTHSILDARTLMSIAFVDMNPFPLRQIQNRRTFHLEKVRLELTELEAIRQTFLRERDTTLDGRTLISDDEEDN